MNISLNDITLPVSIGVFAWEKEAPQTLIISIRFVYDAAAAAAQDAISEAVDYAEMEKRIVAIAQAQHYELIETLVSVLGHAILQEQRITEVEVMVEKPGALAYAVSVSASKVFTR